MLPASCIRSWASGVRHSGCLVVSERFRVAVVGSGPGGLSAAAHAAKIGMSHILLEAAPQPANTIFRYQKGKHVMAEPGKLPLRSDLVFAAGSRETILGNWSTAIEDLGVNIAYQHEVINVEAGADCFRLSCANGAEIEAERVVLGIGLQGNPRKLGVPGESLPAVMYQLDDPADHEDQTIVVVGAGDSAIENALALAKENRVIVINRRGEFTRAKEMNNSAILAAIESDQLSCHYNSSPAEVVEKPSGSLCLRIDTPDGEAEIDCDHVLARLGALPPRRFVESCGVTFPSDRMDAIPAVSAQYESNVPGLFLVGALAGYPLIKQGMNQGYEVIEHIAGNPVVPADETALQERLLALNTEHQVFESADAALDFIVEKLPLFQPLTRLQLREFMLDSQVLRPEAGDIIFRKHDYSTSFFAIVEGEVKLELAPAAETESDESARSEITLGAANFFGEMSLISGRRRSATVRAGNNCVLVETPRRTMNKLIQSVAAVREVLDHTFMLRAIQTAIAPSLTAEDLEDVLRTATLVTFKAGETLFKEGEVGDALFLVRSGSVTVSRSIAGKEKVLAYLPAGHYVGEMALLAESPRSATVRAAVAAECIRLDGAEFKQLLAHHPDVKARIEAEFEKRLAGNMNQVSGQATGLNETSEVVDFLMGQGLGEATDVLLIDESLCVRCDHCEKACASTHGNLSRLNREAGATYASIHVPTSCRHCEHPHCMKECPPDAIHRDANGEVYISDACIGCGNCVANCPYDVIQLGIENPEKPSLLGWLFGLNPAPGEAPDGAGSGRSKVAAKCDMCRDQSAGPACVQACPTGAALRVSPETFMKNYQREPG